MIPIFKRRNLRLGCVPSPTPRKGTQFVRTGARTQTPKPEPVSGVSFCWVTLGRLLALSEPQSPPPLLICQLDRGLGS